MPWTTRIFIILSASTVVSIYCLTADKIEAERSGWSATPNTQYHIQTDEGPERYFRFQTLNGQYRKEKRLKDGTVIGTEGWLDPLGYLRIKDYIADREGFRILKSKMVFVGKERPIEDAVSVSKRVSALSGMLAKPRRPPNPFRQPALTEVSVNSVESNTAKPYKLYSPVAQKYRVPARTVNPRTNYYSSTADPRPISSTNDYLKSTKNYLQPSYTFQSPYEAPYRSPYPFVAKPNAALEPPTFVANVAEPSQPPTSRVNSEMSYSRHGIRAAPNSISPIVPVTAYNSTERRQYRGSSRYYASGDRIDPSVSRGRDIAYSSPSPSRNAGISRRGQSPVYAYDRSDISGSRDTSGTEDHDFPPYDGHHTTGDGFQYYLKSHYHEEEKKPNSDKSIGSFGYVDPFGIRRVVYYKSDPRNGFVHKKNNRYVGLNATPYDPLPLGSQ